MYKPKYNNPTYCDYKPLKHRFSNFFSVVEPLKLLFISRRTPAYRNTHTQTQRLLLAHGDYSGISLCRAKFLAIFRGTVIIFEVFQNNLYTYSTISLGTPNDVPWNSRSRNTALEHSEAHPTPERKKLTYHALIFGYKSCLTYFIPKEHKYFPRGL